MRRAVLALMLCLIAAGCGPGSRSLAYRKPSDTEIGECQRVADKDPKVQQLLLENMYMLATPIHDQQLREARRKAANDCLRARGLDIPGGVEPVNHYNYLL
jgi:hypothetical protein